jgi:hypothetical protein
VRTASLEFLFREQIGNKLIKTPEDPANAHEKLNFVSLFVWSQTTEARLTYTPKATHAYMTLSVAVTQQHKANLRYLCQGSHALCSKDDSLGFFFFSLETQKIHENEVMKEAFNRLTRALREVDVTKAF